MPCMDYQNWTEADTREQTVRTQLDSEIAALNNKLKDKNNLIDKLTAMLCKACKELDKRKAMYIMPQDVQEWWATHDAADRQRKAEEKKQLLNEHDRVRQQLEKLAERIRNIDGD